MDFGLFCSMTRRDRAKTPREIYAETAEQVRLAERAGFGTAWFAEHHFSSYCLCPSPLTMTAYMAGQTSRIRLGTAVIVAPLYEPVRLLEDIGLADQLSGGRLVLGFGTGYQAYEFHKFGVDVTQGRDRLLEVLDLLEAYAAGDPLSFEATRVTLPETHFSVRTLQARPTIYLAGMAGDLEAQRRAAARGYVPFFITGWSSLEAVGRVRDQLCQTHAAAGGDPARMPFALQRYVFVTEDRDEALRAADGARYMRRGATAMRQGHGELDGAFLKEIPAPDEPPLAQIVAQAPIGDAETVAERLARDIEAFRPSHISCFMALPGVSQDRILRSLERFGGEVLPLLERRFGDLGRIGVPAPGARVAP